MSRTTCTVADCKNNYYAKGYCNKHYMRWRHHGDPTIVLSPWGATEQKACKITTCSSMALRSTHGLCPYHHSREYHRASIVAKKRRQTTGWTREEYDAAFLAQDGRCALCGRPGADCNRALHADHCHATGKKRGLLCHRCNSVIEPILTKYFSDPDFRGRWDQYLAP